MTLARLCRKTGLHELSRLNRPPGVLLTALQARHILEEAKFPEYLSAITSRYPKLGATADYQGRDHDQLFRANCDYQEGNTTCEGYDVSRLVHRPERSSTEPAIYYGLIAFGNRMMSHGLTRERLRIELGVPCFEKEAVGLMDNFPCLMIRGICGYADTHKSKHWHAYAGSNSSSVCEGASVCRTRGSSDKGTS
jgi:hypothetical protein